MGGIIQRITEFIKEMLQGWVSSNLEAMFTYVNERTGAIAGEVGRTPETWNAGIFYTVKALSEDVLIPIAGFVITFVLCYELISMVMDKNNMHDFDSGMFFRYLMKACIAVVLVSNTFDITMAVFDVGNYLIVSAGEQITGSTSINVQETIAAMAGGQMENMGIGELVGLGMETMIVRFIMEIMALLITVILYGRMVEIYLYISVAPIPFATWTNREWGSVGTNYFKGLVAMAFQGFFIMVCVAVYAALVSGISVAANLHSALWEVAGYTVLLSFCLLKTGSLSRSIFNAH